jgi:hypothetical protein
MDGKAAWVTRKTPNTLVSNWRRQSASCRSSIVPITDARVVDEHVDRTSLCKNQAQRGPHRSIVANVEIDGFESQVLLARQSIQLRALFRRPAGGKDAIAAFGQEQGGGLAQTVGRSGDQNASGTSFAAHLPSLQSPLS